MEQADLLERPNTKSKSKPTKESQSGWDTAIDIAGDLGLMILQGAAMAVGGIIVGKAASYFEPSAEITPLRKIG